MKFDQFLNEMPLPSTWDQTKFESFKELVDYADTKAKRVGSGSSRIAFNIKHNNEETILKVAKNTKGIEQNKAEIEYMLDDEVKEMGIIIPIIDYDEESFHWIHTKKAKPIKIEDFVSNCGGTLAEVISYIKYFMKESGASIPKSLVKRLDVNSSLVNHMKTLYDIDKIVLNDLIHIENWGLYKNKPVIIDIGLTSDTIHLYQKDFEF